MACCVGGGVQSEKETRNNAGSFSGFVANGGDLCATEISAQKRACRWGVGGERGEREKSEGVRKEEEEEEATRLGREKLRRWQWGNKDQKMCT